MPTYVALLNWTDQGIRDFKETLSRANSAATLAESLGAKLVQTYWTMGEYDVVGILEAPDDETATAFALGIGSGGAARTSTLRAFDREEIQAIVAKTG
jgi:uncharacterized protein with GYD domain